MRIAVTGAAGFLGTHLVKVLRERGHDVVTTDRHSQVDAAFDLESIPQLEWFLTKYEPEVVVHLAAQVGRLFSDDNLMNTIHSNAGITAHVARACGERGIRLAYCSTSEIYGDHDHVVCQEYDGPFSLPHNIYGLSKQWGEQVSHLYAPKKLIIFRPSMPYGSGAPPGRGRRALDNFLWQAHHRMPIPVHRGSERSWCWVGDTVRGMALVLEKGDGVYNVGRDDDPRSMLDLAKMACEIVGAPESLIEEVDPPKAQTIVKRLSTERLRGLGWEPTVELEEGLREVLEWVKRFDPQGREIVHA